MVWIGNLDNNLIETVKEPHSCPLVLREIKIHKSTLEKIFILAEETPEVLQQSLEVYCFLVGNSEEAIVTDILIPKQRVSYASIDIDGAALVELSETVKTMGEGMAILGWAHSHANFTVFSSHRDNQNHNTILNQTNNILIKNNQNLKYMFSITVNERRETFGVILVQYPCGLVLQRNKARISIIEDKLEDTDIEEMRNIISQAIEERVEIHTFATSLGTLDSQTFSHRQDSFFIENNQDSHPMIDEDLVYIHRQSDVGRWDVKLSQSEYRRQLSEYLSQQIEEGDLTPLLDQKYQTRLVKELLMQLQENSTPTERTDLHNMDMQAIVEKTISYTVNSVIDEVKKLINLDYLPKTEQETDVDASKTPTLTDDQELECTGTCGRKINRAEADLLDWKVDSLGQIYCPQCQEMLHIICKCTNCNAEIDLSVTDQHGWTCVYPEKGRWLCPRCNQ
ncbi:MAG: hypothetical protein ACFFC7_10065 [Candidatus Hermodarchaeota archaeon]